MDIDIKDDNNKLLEYAIIKREHNIIKSLIEKNININNNHVHELLRSYAMYSCVQNRSEINEQIRKETSDFILDYLIKKGYNGPAVLLLIVKEKEGLLECNAFSYAMSKRLYTIAALIIAQSVYKFTTEDLLRYEKIQEKRSSLLQ